MKTIELTQGKVALVDDEDYDFLMQWKWQASRTSYGFYALGYTKGPHSKRKHLIMHRLIMNTPRGLCVDHRDHNTLNNQKNNLRNCTTSENSKNRKHDKRKVASIYRGVRIDRRKYGVYIKANIVINKKLVHLGNFKTEEQAAVAWDCAARKYYGEFANLNFPENG